MNVTSSAESSFYDSSEAKLESSAFLRAEKTAMLKQCASIVGNQESEILICAGRYFCNALQTADKGDATAASRRSARRNLKTSHSILYHSSLRWR